MILGRLLVLLAVIAIACAAYIEPTVWPQPVSFTKGSQNVFVREFSFVTSGLRDAPRTLTEAYSRYNNLIFTHRASGSSSSTNPRLSSVVEVSCDSYSEDYPQLDTDESYTLYVPEKSSENIKISAKTVYGALRAIESLSQVVIYDFDEREYVIPAAPISIRDTPRYAHRGLLLDTSRHFQPLSSLKHTVDALSYAKMNVLHWHVVDTQSFPFESTTFPLLWSGAFSKTERYSKEDIQDLVEYSRLRGVRVMIEFDMPGHAASWCTGYPEICPSMSCKQPLNPASNLTFSLIDSLLSECTGRVPGSGSFPYSLLHLGGDEVSYTCWEQSPEIIAWEQSQNLQGSEATYEYFVDRAATIARSQGRTPVQWIEVFEHFGDKLDKNTVVHVWKEKSTMDAVLTAGYKALLSNQNQWYLDHLETTWDQMYLNEPTEGLSSTSDPSLIIGGETCMWGETVDPSDVGNTIWPRAAAVAERLWTPLDRTETASTIDKAQDRLETFRCLLTQRGVAAAPVTNKVARFQPREPGSCYVQRR